ncbi:MAG: hypothetical protein GYA65_14795, partial [Actinobacteria bacterium]|nr:hypothetical protein [Actinomycetota bacterium]
MLLATCAFFALFSDVTHAEDEILQVRVQNTATAGGKREPVAGVAVTVTDPGGAVVAEGVTD